MKKYTVVAMVALVLVCVLALSGCSNPIGDSPIGGDTAAPATPVIQRAMVNLAGATITNPTPDSSLYSNIFITDRLITLSSFKIARYETTYHLWE
jgi:hypothetical protein